MLSARCCCDKLGVGLYEFENSTHCSFFIFAVHFDCTYCFLMVASSTGENSAQASSTFEATCDSKASYEHVANYRGYQLEIWVK
jgi:hypothetical protein